MTSRAIVWMDAATAHGVTDDGITVTPRIGGRRRNPQTVDYLNTAARTSEVDVITVYLTGPRPMVRPGGKVADWLLTPTPGFTPARHYMDADRPVGRFTTASGRRFELRRAAELLGDVDDPRTARDAWALVSAAWRQVWDTPLLQSLPASGRITLNAVGAGKWPAVTDATAQLIRETTPQHRIQLVRQTADVEGSMPGFFYLDARWSYVALLRELGVGEPEHLVGTHAATYAELNPYDRARYRVRFYAPRPLYGIGVFSTREHGWTAMSGETWCDAAELFVARRHGWRVDVFEALVWDGAIRTRTLDTWRDRMLRVVDQINRPVGASPEVMAVAVGVVRSVILQTLGALHATAAHNVVFVPTADGVPVEARSTMVPRGDGWTYQETVPLPAGHISHPELTAQIWGRAHARILDHKDAAGNPAGALNVDPATLIALHGDAIYLTKDPGWADDGKVGRMRIKGMMIGQEIPWPKTMAQVYALARKSEHTQ